MARLLTPLLLVSILLVYSGNPVYADTILFANLTTSQEVPPTVPGPRRALRDRYHLERQCLC